MNGKEGPGLGSLDITLTRQTIIKFAELERLNLSYKRSRDDGEMME